MGFCAFWNFWVRQKKITIHSLQWSPCINCALLEKSHWFPILCVDYHLNNGVKQRCLKHFDCRKRRESKLYKTVCELDQMWWCSSTRQLVSFSETLICYLSVIFSGRRLLTWQFWMRGSNSLLAFLHVSALKDISESFFYHDNCCQMMLLLTAFYEHLSKLKR